MLRYAASSLCPLLTPLLDRSAFSLSRCPKFRSRRTATPLDLYTNHFKLVDPYNSSNDPSDIWSYKSSFTPPLYIFNYATGVLALLSNTPGVDLSCETGTCGYDPKVCKTVGIADPSLAPY